MPADAARSDSGDRAECELVERAPGPEEYNHLRRSVGWGTYPLEAIAQALPRSLYCVCALSLERLIGMGRVIGDGALVYYIQDVIVLPEYQRQGIGTQLMERIMAYLGARALPNAVIGLMAASGKEAFYERYGFTRRPSERLGCGMTSFWPAQGARRPGP
jgi:ribosomal protein S18 acetylase RimI-like enzyme